MNTETPMAKFDVATLKQIEGVNTPSPVSVLVPRNMGEAMEFAKMMAATRFVPPHLRGNASDCLAVVMFSSRVEADPFAVASKTYFVNDRMAFEAQLVVALINTRAPLVGRLHYEWTGEGNSLSCTVTGKLRGDTREKSVTQAISSITTKNSPLWKSNPAQQLGYLTARMWGRLHTPEVLLGIYTPDELQDMGPLERSPDGTYTAPPPRPTRAEFTEAEPLEFQVFNESGEIIQRSTDPAVFVGALRKYVFECPDGRALEAAEEYHREQVMLLPDDLKLTVAGSYDEALKTLDRKRTA